ncbi:alpha/beta fold hydrolase [Candidatus Nomurabacteria bacterium]|nr:alpha/beta fold hydrolase [Candidatus Nomurabacteria bacterium]
MAQKNIHPYAQSIALRGKNEIAIFLIHGYTGSPTDFNGLPLFLYEHYGVSVFVPLLPGHGSCVEDLRGFTKDDFIKFTEEELKPLLSSYSKVIIGGHSFGGQLALDIASRYPVGGVFVTALPYKLYFPLSIPRLYEFWHKLSFKEFLKKILSSEQKRARIGSFSYEHMPAYGLKLASDMNKELKKSLPKLKHPLLSIFFTGDSIAHPKSAHEIKKLVGSKINKIMMLDNMGHGVFFTEDAPKIYKEIAKFFEIR